MNRSRIRPALVAAAAILVLAPTGPAATAAQATPHAAAAAAVNSDTETIITGTAGLNRGEAWYSPDRQTMLVQQTDGHVVLYHQGRAIWTAVGSYGYGNTFYMQADGNLVSYDAAMRPLWNSATDRHWGAHLAVQNGGNIAVYYGGTPIWWSNFRPGGPVDPDPGECHPRPNHLCP
ncbi:hypothetical protein ACWGA0_31475 [Streptomyces erythrochromogenes]